MSSFALGLKALRRLCEEQNASKWYGLKLRKELFKPSEVAVFEYVQNHVVKHHALPQLATLLKAFPQELTEVECPEPGSYYVEKVENRFYHETITNANVSAATILKNNQDDHEAAVGVLKTALNVIAEQQYRQKILNVNTELAAMVMSEYHNHFGASDACYFGWPYLDNIAGGVIAGDVISFIGRPAQGKAQPLDSLVLGVKGFKRMGDIQVGDDLASVDGLPSKVTGVFPQGIKPVYRLTFIDGRTAESSDEHLWEVMYRDWDAPQILTTLQLIAKLKHKRYRRRLSIRYFSGEWGVETPFALSPYLLGALLGDGCFRSNSPTFSTEDPQIVARLQRELQGLGCYLEYVDRCNWRIVNCRSTDYNKRTVLNPLKIELQALGLWGKYSQEKTIPEQYMTASAHQRWELLRGLMDTDGTAGKDGQATFCSTSRLMAEQVCTLVQGLGGKASIGIKKTSSLDAYIVGIVINARSRLFSLDRKKARVSHERTTHKQTRLTLDRIEYIGDKECQCIAVDHPEHLYITDNFVVTHNTFQMLYSALHNWREKQKNVLFVSMEMSLLPIGQRIAAMYAHTGMTQLKTHSYANMGPGSPYKKFVSGLQAIKGEKGSLYVVDGNLAASVDDLFALADLLSCEAVWIDGAYLLRHRNGKLDRNQRATENVELLKHKATDDGKKVFCSWQFNREATKKQKKGGDSGDLEDIGNSDAIGQISSIVLGLFQHDGVETMIKRRIKVLKGRSGEVGEFEIYWNFSSMDFSQVETHGEVKELAHI